MSNVKMSEKEYIELVERERAERAARVRQFILEHEENEINDLFDAMRDIVDTREADETFYLSKFFHQVRDVFDNIEEKLCNP